LPAIERRTCPEAFQERLTRAVGVNPYGEPLWKIVWGQTATFTAGGYWPHDGFLGYRQLMLSNGALRGEGEPCWMVLEWRPPEKYGSPALYYFENRDEYTELQTLGEYPYRGRYEVAFKLTSQELRNGRLEVLHYQLDGFILDWLVPLLQTASKMSAAERQARAKQRTELDTKAFDTNFADALKSAKDTDYGGNRTQRQLDRELMMRKQMSGFLRKYGRPRPGMQQGKFQS
jgi:hypothetical protein